ncbi:MAG TPA: hypothetical protein VG267_10430 [Terracidiphilus sp.]|nr:hypothetical protein [Terracidiphilus sp.]
MKNQNHRNLPILFRVTLLAILLPALHTLCAQNSVSSPNLAERRAESYGGGVTGPGDLTGPLDRCPDGCHFIRFNHWWVSLPSLPGKQSSHIVIGDISTCISKLSKDKTTVFTECMLSIGRVLKSGENIASGSIVTVTREGGSVSVDSKKMSEGIEGQRLPSAHKEYAFFLVYRPMTDDYKILTFYELTDHGITAADEPRYFHAHDGKSLDTFLGDVNSSIQDETPYLRPHDGGAK